MLGYVADEALRGNLPFPRFILNTYLRSFTYFKNSQGTRT
jgi:hypothetical protein